MRIQLNRTYSGPLINELPSGEYDEADERLHGRAAYLVGIEVAVWVDAPDAETVDTPVVEVKPVSSKRGKGK